MKAIWIVIFFFILACVSSARENKANLSKEDMEIIENLELLQELEFLQNLEILENMDLEDYEMIKDMDILELEGGINEKN